MKRLHLIWYALLLAGPLLAPGARAEEPDTEVPRLWILASDGAVRHRDLVKPAMDSLIAMGEEAVPFLLAYLHTEDARERHAITDIFKGIGSPAVPALTGVLGTGGEYHTLNTLNALAKIGDPSASPAIVPYLQDARYSVRAMAAEALGKDGGAGVEAALFTALRDTIEIVRKSTVVALGRLGRQSSADSLQALLRDPWFGVRYAAAAALVDIDSGRVAIDRLPKLQNRSRALVLNALADAHIETAARRAADVLSDSSFVVRAAAVRVLSGAPQDRRAQSQLEHLRSDDPNPLVRNTAAGATPEP